MKTITKHTALSLPARHHLNVLGPWLKLIARSIIHAAAAESGADARARTFSVFSHLATMLFVQLAHALSLNDVCAWLRLTARAIAAFGVTPPSRNNLSHANRERKASFIETVFWRTLAHLQRCEPGFGTRRPGGTARRLLHRFKVRIHAVDATVRELVANCMDWAKHRRRSRSPREGLRQTASNELPAGRRSREAATESTPPRRCICASDWRAFCRLLPSWTPRANRGDWREPR